MPPEPVPAAPGWDEDLAYLDLLLGKDSRPGGTPGAAPPGFASRVTLTAPLATLTGLADRLGELSGLGPVDPWLARDLARATARNPKTTWCLTVTDDQGHAIAHGCARPEPKRHGQRAGPDPPAETGFTFTPASRDGPPGGCGTWILRTPGPGPGLIITIDPVTTDPCDHRHQAKGHDPGVRLRHLSQVRHANRPATPSEPRLLSPRTSPGSSGSCSFARRRAPSHLVPRRASSLQQSQLARPRDGLAP